MNKKTFIFNTVILMLFAGLLSNAQAANISHETVFQFGSNEVVGTSTLLRSKTGVSFSVETHGPGDGSSLDDHATTIWLVVFNKPENCTIEGGDLNHPACSLDDVMSAMSGGSNEAEIDILYGAGNIIGKGSQAHFSGHKSINDLKDAAFGIGLKDTSVAEIHLVVRSHGPAVPGQGDSRGNVAEQIGSFIGGCNGVAWFSDLGEIPVNSGECNDIFFSVHKP